MARNDRRRDEDRDQDDQTNGDLMPDAEGAPNPLEHATPNEELLEEQLAIGRPDASEVPSEEELEAFEEEEAGRAPAAPAAGALATTRSSSREPGRRRDATRQSADSAVAHTEHKQPLPARLMGFLHGSWNELHRVQWPDRRQVAQATGVVLGFVIVAGAFLGVADLVASKLVTLLIK